MFSKEAITTQNALSVTTEVNTIWIIVLTDWFITNSSSRFCGESFVLGNCLVSYADSYSAGDPKTNCPFSQKGNCPEIGCPLFHPLCKPLCANWKFQGMTFPGTVLYLNFSCSEKDRAFRVPIPSSAVPQKLLSLYYFLLARQVGGSH